MSLSVSNTNRESHAARIFNSLKSQAVLLLTFLVLILLIQVVISQQSQQALTRNQELLQQSYVKVEKISQIERNLLDLQRTVLIYKETASTISNQRFAELIKVAWKDINSLEEISEEVENSSEQIDVIRRMREHLKDYEVNFESVVQGRERRSQIFRNNLQNHFEEAAELIAQKTTIVNENRTRILLHLSQAKSFSFQYLLSPEYEYTEAFYREIATIEEAMTFSSVDDVHLFNAINIIKNDFNILSQVTRGYLFLVNVVMAGSANEFLFATKELRKAFTLEQEKTQHDVKELAREIKLRGNSVSLLCIAIALIIAIFIIIKILTPVERMTQVFTALSEGENVEDIPGAKRSDEIGLLAKAANIFRLKNAQTIQLLDQAKQLNSIQEELNRELSLQKEKAEQATQMKSSFLANMSHEIRTPMNGIIGLVELAKNTEAADKKRFYLDKIAYSSEIMMNVINDILDFSKIEAGKLEIDYAEFDTDKLIDNLITATYLRASEKGLNFRCHLSTPMPTRMIGDAMRINQILLNLCSNAIKFTEKGDIDIYLGFEQARNDQSYLQVSVVDTGIGMSEEQTARIFDSFQQADGSTSRKYGGTGLGLTIVRQLTELMQGEIDVTSTPGRGSRFDLRVSVESISGISLYPHEQKHQIIYCSSHNPSLLNFELESLGIAPSVEKTSIDELDISLAPAEALILIDCRSHHYFHENRRFIELALQQNLKVGLITDMQPLGLKEQIKEHLPCPVLSHPFTPGKLEQFFDRLHKTGNLKKSDSDTTRRVAKLEGHVLLVEDNDINQIVAGDMLQAMGLSYDVAENGQVAVDMVENNDSYNLILMDIQMPVMDGYEATRQIRARGHQLAICALTANAMKHEIEQAESAGITDYITKPIDWSRLESTLKKFLA